MKGLKLVVICIVLYLFERVFFPYFRIFSQTPWLMFAFCMAFAVREEDFVRPVMAAALCGLLNDLGGGGASGIGMSVYAVSAALVNVFSVRVFSGGMMVGLLLVFLFSMPAELIYCAANYQTDGIMTVLLKTALPLSILNTVFAFVLYPLAGRVRSGGRRVV